jgi:hypothetical protein
VQFEEHTTFDNALEICGIQSVDHISNQHLTRSEEEPEEEVAEHKATFLHALK